MLLSFFFYILFLILYSAVCSVDFFLYAGFSSVFAVQLPIFLAMFPCECVILCSSC